MWFLLGWLYGRRRRGSQRVVQTTRDARGNVVATTETTVHPHRPLRNRSGCATFLLVLVGLWFVLWPLMIESKGRHDAATWLVGGVWWCILAAVVVGWYANHRQAAAPRVPRKPASLKKAEKASAQALSELEAERERQEATLRLRRLEQETARARAELRKLQERRPTERPDLRTTDSG